VHVTLIEDEKICNATLQRKARFKTPKKSTVDITHELWLDKNSIQDIATIRKLTTQTIESHLVKLIQSKKSVQDILPQDKIKELGEAFKHYKEESLTAMKEQFGDKYSWDELRMFKASLN
jgi:uncharacterized protein YpbB